MRALRYLPSVHQDCIITELRSERYPRPDWYFDSEEQCVPQSARVRNREVAEVAAAQGLQDRAGAVSEVRVVAHRAEQVVFLVQGAAGLSWQAPVEGYSGARHTTRARRGRGLCNSARPRRHRRAYRGPCHDLSLGPTRNCW